MDRWRNANVSGNSTDFVAQIAGDLSRAGLQVQSNGSVPLNEPNLRGIVCGLVVVTDGRKPQSQYPSDVQLNIMEVLRYAVQESIGHMPAAHIVHFETSTNDSTNRHVMRVMRASCADVLPADRQERLRISTIFPAESGFPASAFSNAVVDVISVSRDVMVVEYRMERIGNEIVLRQMEPLDD